ncbi:MAG: AraC family transcriptional regulator [Clostridia bacterium]|nr:AraC family transcriptional regulator [Clostridia bacterium]
MICTLCKIRTSNRSFLKEFDEKDLLLWDNVSIVHADKIERISIIFNELLAEYKTEQNATLLKSLVCELVILLRRKKEIKEKTIENSISSKRISKVISFLNSDYYTKITLEIMLDTDKNITQITLDVGFGSTNHFCKVFKSVMKMSPLQYKKAFKKMIIKKIKKI